MKKISIIFFSVITMICADAFSQVAKYQAAYMYNFFTFIEWPADYRSGDCTSGVLGSGDAIVPELQAIAKAKKVISQSIKVVTFNSVGEITKCNVLFVSSKQGSNIGGALSKIGSNSTLLVTNSSGGISKGAAINFTVVGGKLAFELKSSNAKKQNVKINSNLNQLASKVY